jgi:hypothetical protein
MAKLKRFIWKTGQTHGVLELGQAGRLVSMPSKPHVMVTNDGEQWVAQQMSDYVHAGKVMKFIEDRTGVQAMRMGGPRNLMEPEVRLPLEWAIKEIRKQKPADGVTIQTEAQASAKSVVRIIDGLGPEQRSIQFTGWETVKRVSAHSLDDLVEAFAAAAEMTQKAWNWKWVNLQVKFHTEGNAFGLAYNPGGGEHIISLHKRMLAEFTLDSTYRTILHELCHHYRDERFQPSADAHDAIFCRELAKVDETVKDGRRMCMHFVDVPDPALVAKALKRTNKTPPIWSPEAGTLLVRYKKSRQFSLVWAPNQGFKWSSWTHPLSTTTLMLLMRQFDVKQWGQVDVMSHPKGSHGWWHRRVADEDVVISLRQFLSVCVESWPRAMKPIADYMQEAQQ